jgi:hypothetical protein
MYHPLLLQPEVLRDLPALLEDRRPRRPEPAMEPSYRSEAFAEDLCVEPLPPVHVAAPLMTLLGLAPLLVAVAGVGVAVLG